MTSSSKSRFIVFLGLLLCFVGCNQSTESSKVIVQDPFFGVIPESTPKLLAPELLASPTEEYNGTFSPDGREFYYTTDIPENAFITFTELMPDNTWSEPKVASFSGKYSDYDPIFSPDGSRLYFSSSRPEPDNKNSKNWYVDRTDTGWSEPKQIVLTGKENGEYYSSATKNGILYFNIWSTGDLFKATPTDSSYLVEKLPEIINGGADKGDPFISPDEDYLIYRGYGEESLGRGDFFISFNIDGQWTRPENLGEPINSAAHEMCPYVTPDGKLFIFASARITDKVAMNPLEPISKVHDKFRSYNNGRPNIYYISANFIEEMRKKHENR